ncbi:hypothetical protein P7K49_023532 [Saguinus oedipus]|uniref:DNA/RNA non-specific endonuclease/pyrophosphatase/phosphodiesterase domain-containing protein n=1 Tax=Saguinus oedipus TaxID=9490 RepID=A0ABQ9ULZ4_SAGOE|nr:hypothetical protein P7K49_023532 [Saguinus oedipus]
MELSKYLRDYSRTIPEKQQLLIGTYAKALEVIPRQLCDNFSTSCGLSMPRGTWYGVDMKEDSADNFEAFVWEPAVVRINALTAASEAACLILSVDEPRWAVDAPPAAGRGGAGPGALAAPTERHLTHHMTGRLLGALTLLGWVMRFYNAGRRELAVGAGGRARGSGLLGRLPVLPVATAADLPAAPGEPAGRVPRELAKDGLPGLAQLKSRESYDPHTRGALWVVEQLRSERLRGDGDRRACDFLEDDSVREYHCATNADYRGHLAAAANHRWSQEATDYGST